jgi:hypothetical protein
MQSGARLNFHMPYIIVVGVSSIYKGESNHIKIMTPRFVNAVWQTHLLYGAMNFRYYPDAMRRLRNEEKTAP